MAATLDSTVRLISMQFNFSNPSVIPPKVKCLDKETPEERTIRKSRSTGVMVIEPTEGCSIVQFLEELKRAGYELVDAGYKQRIDAKDPKGKRMYYMTRFIFVRSELVESSDEFKAMQGILCAELQQICEDALWRVRAYNNPFYKNDEEVPGQHAVSLNFEARQPLFHPDGQTVMIWQKDAENRRVGTAPLPLKGKYHLNIVDHAVQLVTA